MRFNRTIHLTRHARERMIARSIDDDVLVDLLETGELRFRARSDPSGSVNRALLFEIRAKFTVQVIQPERILL